MRSLEEELKVTLMRQALLNSCNPKVASGGVKVRTWRKWSAEESHFCVSQTAGGSSNMGEWQVWDPFNTVMGKEMSQLVQQEVREAAEDKRASRIAVMKNMAWTSVIRQWSGNSAFEDTATSHQVLDPNKLFTEL